jgi:hypothetical protein
MVRYRFIGIPRLDTRPISRDIRLGISVPAVLLRTLVSSHSVTSSPLLRTLVFGSVIAIASNTMYISPSTLLSHICPSRTANQYSLMQNLFTSLPPSSASSRFLLRVELFRRVCSKTQCSASSGPAAKQCIVSSTSAVPSTSLSSIGICVKTPNC